MQVFWYFKKKGDNQQETKMSTIYENDFKRLQTIEEINDDDKSQEKSNDSFLFSKSGSFFQKEKYKESNQKKLIMKFPKKNTIIDEDVDNYSLNRENKISTNNDQIQINKYQAIWKEQKINLNFSVNVQEMKNSNFKLAIWSSNKKVNKDKLYLVGETFHFISKIIHNAKKQNLDDKLIQKFVEIESDLKLDGNIIAKSKFKLLIQYPNFFEQKYAGVMTEEGLKNNDPIIIQIKTKASNNKKLLHDYYYILSDEILQKKNSNNPQYFIHYQNQVNSHIKKINDILTQYQRKSIHKITYENATEMMKTQSILIKIGQIILSSYKDFDDMIGQNMLKGLRLIFEREEFFLNYIGFQEASQIKEGEQQEKRILIGLEFQCLLYQTLELTLKLITQSLLQDFEKKFVEFYLAYAYFRIKEFRQILLLTMKNNSIKNKIVNGNYQNLINLKWNKDFFDKLEYRKEFKINNKYLLEFLEEKKWIEKLFNSNKFICAFICEWCSQIEYNVISLDIQWEKIEGYSQITGQYIEIIKKKKDKDDKFIKAGIMLMNHPANVNIFLSTLIKNTNLFDQKEVIKFFDTISKWFKVFQINKKPLPQNLDIPHLIQMTLLLFNTYHAFAIANALNFWYQFFPLFPINLLQSLIEVLIKFYFYDLFLHWSKNVRTVFYYILSYRIITAYQKDNNLLDGELKNLVHLLNKRIYLVNECGKQYQIKFKKRLQTRFGTKNKIDNLSSEIMDMFKQLNAKNIYETPDMLLLQISLKQNFNIQPHLNRRYSSNLITVLNESQLNDIEEQEQEQENKVQKIRNYQNIINFKRINKTVLKKKQLIYCQPNYKEFLEIFKQAKKDYQFIDANPYSVPVLAFQQPLDCFENNFDDDSDW